MTHQLAEPSIVNDHKDSRYLLLQVKVALDAQQKAQLEELGVELLQYVPEDTYLCRFAEGELSRVRALEFVTWANPFMKRKRV